MQNASRIGLYDNLLDAMVKIAEGNPGAINALAQLSIDAAAVDPDSIWKEFGPLLGFDSMGLYGSHIYVLFNEVCGGDTLKCHTLQRAAQLGIIRAAEVKAAALSGRPTTFDFLHLLEQVRKQLPAFGGVRTVAKS